MSANKTKKAEIDVIVVGGGPAGCTMAALLAANGISALCIDRDDPTAATRASFDGRTTAISFGSRRVIAAAGAWDSLSEAACPITDIRIMESGSESLLDFDVADVDAPAFGWIVENRHLRQSLYERLKALPKAQHMAPARVTGFAVDGDSVSVELEDGITKQAKLVIGADGRNSFTREWMGIGTRTTDYHQRAIVCIVTHEHPHNNGAVEDFRSEGPFAILPMAGDDKGRHRSSIVWTEHGNHKKSAASWDDTTFNAALQERFPPSYGRVATAGPRFSYPLGLTHAHSYIGPRMALIADAAHAIHPIAGQGLNMGLRDVAALAELLIAAKKEGRDPGAPTLLQEYERMRKADNIGMEAATHSLNSLFSNDHASVRSVRVAGLKLIQRLPATRRFFMRQAMGASGLLPTLIKTGKF